MKKLLHQHQSVIKFLATGIFVFLFNLVVLSLFTEAFKIWYLVSSVVSYALSVVLNFTLQKFWVFENSSNEKTKRQFIFYLFVSCTCLILNTFFMYLLVDYARIHYLISQAFITAALATLNFFINRNFIFAEK